MNGNESSEKQNNDYEKERVETNKEILRAIRSFIEQAIYTSIVTLGLAVLYAVLYIFFISPKTDVKTCIKEIGTLTPLFIIVSTIAVEGGVRIMEWAVAKRARRKDEEKRRDAKTRAEGEAKVINALQEAQKNGIPLEKALETYQSKSTNKDD